MYLIVNGGVYSDELKNTEESILLANNQSNIDGVMVNVFFSSDGELVINENDLIESNYYISQLSYDEIKKIKRFSKLKKIQIPLLKDIVKRYKKEILVINLHSNFENNLELANELHKILQNCSINKIVINVNNLGLYEYFKKNNYEVYFDNNSKIIFIDIKTINVNDKTIKSIKTNNNYIANLIINNQFIEDNIYIVSNNPSLLLKKIN